MTNREPDFRLVTMNTPAYIWSNVNFNFNYYSDSSSSLNLVLFRRRFLHSKIGISLYQPVATGMIHGNSEGISNQLEYYSEY